MFRWLTVASLLPLLLSCSLAFDGGNYQGGSTEPCGGACGAGFFCDGEACTPVDICADEGCELGFACTDTGCVPSVCDPQCAEDEICLEGECEFDCLLCAEDEECNPLRGCLTVCDVMCSDGACGLVGGDLVCCDDDEGLDGVYQPFPGCEKLGPTLDCMGRRQLDCASESPGGCPLGPTNTPSDIIEVSVEDAPGVFDIALVEDRQAAVTFHIVAARPDGMDHYVVTDRETTVQEVDEVPSGITAVAARSFGMGEGKQANVAIAAPGAIATYQIVGGALMNGQMTVTPNNLPVVAVGQLADQGPAFVWADEESRIHWGDFDSDARDDAGPVGAIGTLQAAGHAAFAGGALVAPRQSPVGIVGGESSLIDDVGFFRPPRRIVHIVESGQVLVRSCNRTSLVCDAPKLALNEDVSLLRALGGFTPALFTVEEDTEIPEFDRVVVHTVDNDFVTNPGEFTAFAWRQVGEPFQVLDLEAAIGTLQAFNNEYSLLVAALIQTESGKRQIVTMGLRVCLGASSE